MTKTLADRVCAVMAEVGNVEKDKSNDFHKYKYTSAEAVRAKVQKACAANGLMLRLTYAQEEVSPTLSVMKASCFVSMDGETFVLLGEGWGAGVDKGEKSPMKACTSSTKYALANAFCIALGDDPEADTETDKTADRKARKAAATDDGTMGAPLHTYAMDEGQKARAAKQAESRPSDDEARLQADGWVSQFTAMTHVDEVTAFLPTMIAQWDKSPAKHRSRVYKACQSHVEKGIVEGLSDVGFREAWGLYVGLARDGKVS